MNRAHRATLLLMILAGSILPVLADANKVKSLSSDMTATIRRLRLNLKSVCPECERYRGCYILFELNATINQAVAEINEEWDLASTLK